MLETEIACRTLGHVLQKRLGAHSGSKGGASKTKKLSWKGRKPKEAGGQRLEKKNNLGGSLRKGKTCSKVLNQMGRGPYTAGFLKKIFQNYTDLV